VSENNDRYYYIDSNSLLLVELTRLDSTGLDCRRKGKQFDANFWVALCLMVFIFTYPLAMIFAYLYFFDIMKIG